MASKKKRKRKKVPTKKEVIRIMDRYLRAKGPEMLPDLLEHFR